MATNSNDPQQVPQPLSNPNPIVMAGIKYRKEVILLVCVLIAFGIYALKVMDKNEFPSFTIREGVVAAVYPGATVEQIENEVLKPLEDYIFSYKQVDKKNTHSQISAGMLIIFVELDNDVQDSKPFWNEFKIGMEQVKLTLPPGVLAVETLSNFGDTSALLITMQSDDKTYRELGDYMDRLKRPPAHRGERWHHECHRQADRADSRISQPRETQALRALRNNLGATLLAQGFQTTGGSLKSGHSHAAYNCDAVCQHRGRRGRHDSALNARRPVW